MNWRTRSIIASSMLLGGIASGAFASRYLEAKPSLEAYKGGSLAPPYRVQLSGSALLEQASTRLQRDLQNELNSRADQFNKRLVVSSVVYNRVGGLVSADGALADGMGPRAVAIVLDAYGEDGSYLASSKAEGASSRSSTAFRVAMVDQPDFSRFVIRVLDAQGSEIKVSSASDVAEVGPSLSMQTPLLAPDYRFLARRLRDLGYIDGRGVPEPVVMVSILKRFRGDHGVQVSDDRVTLGDLYMVLSVAASDEQFVLSRYYQINVDRVRRDAPEVQPAPRVREREAETAKSVASAPVDDQSEAVMLSDSAM